AKASGNVLARAAVDDEFQNFSLTPAQALKQVVPGLSHLVDISEHVAWCFCRIPQQRRTPARPQDPAVPTAITSGARNLLLTKREQFFGYCVVVFFVNDVGDALATQFSWRVAQQFSESPVCPDYIA